jgi:hypothetical protein
MLLTRSWSLESFHLFSIILLISYFIFKYLDILLIENLYRIVDIITLNYKDFKPFIIIAIITNLHKFIVLRLD